MDKLVVRGTEINVQWNPNRDDYISLTDIARIKDSDNPRYIIQNWMRNRNTIEFLGVWESLYNPDFNRVEFDAFRSQAGLNSFVMTPQKWIEATHAIGITAKAGRYGGTYAHKEIAFEFASWISVEFKLYLVKEFERLKTEEMKQLGWDIKRNLAKINYRIHTDAIKENLIPPELTPYQISLVYASEVDVLNMALFGMTAKQWRDANPDKKGNIRWTKVEVLNSFLRLSNTSTLILQEKALIFQAFSFPMHGPVIHITKAKNASLVVKKRKMPSFEPFVQISLSTLSFAHGAIQIYPVSCS